MHLFGDFKKGGPVVVVLVACFFLLSASPSPGKDISIQVPGELLSQLIHDILPVHLPIKERGFSGDIWIESIEDLALGDNEVRFQMDIRGKDVRYVTKIRNRPLNLRFGNIKMLLKCRGCLRYAFKEKTLYITAYAAEEIDEKKSTGMMMRFSPLVALFNGVEYPVKIQDLTQVITLLGNRRLKFDFAVSDIRTRENMLFFDVKPSVKAFKTNNVSSPK